MWLTESNKVKLPVLKHLDIASNLCLRLQKKGPMQTAHLSEVAQWMRYRHPYSVYK